MSSRIEFNKGNMEQNISKSIDKRMKKEEKKIQKKVRKEYSDAYLKLKKEVSRKASMANKRLVRLENNKLTDLPAYKQWKSYNGGVKFSVRGKDYNQLQQEMARLNHFINSKTSTIRSANKVLKEIASNTGIKYNSVKELQSKSKQFFELASKVEQYLQNIEHSAMAIGYQKIWDTVNEYVKKQKIDLSDSGMDIDKATMEIVKLTQYDVIEKGTEYPKVEIRWDW